MESASHVVRVVNVVLTPSFPCQAGGQDRTAVDCLRDGEHHQSNNLKRPAMTKDIIHKLHNELDAGINSEAQVVYLLTGIRKILERDSHANQYGALKFHCDCRRASMGQLRRPCSCDSTPPVDC
jgi:hypothetical protein